MLRVFHQSLPRRRSHFLIGFSRGAYTVRSLANLLMLCGVPTKCSGVNCRVSGSGFANMRPSTQFLNMARARPRATYENERFEMARRFCESYMTGSTEHGGDSNDSAYFIGVFRASSYMFSPGAVCLSLPSPLLSPASLIFDVQFWTSLPNDCRANSGWKCLVLVAAAALLKKTI